MGTENRWRKEAERALAASEELKALLEASNQRLKAAEAQLERQTSDVERLEKEVVRMGEREQERIGQELHDDLAQQLVGMSLLAQMLVAQLKREGHARAVEASELSHYLAGSIKATRDLAKSLVPIEEGGLLEALEKLAARTETFSKVKCQLNLAGGLECRASEQVHLYRIVEEAVRNAIEHGKARSIVVEWESGGSGWQLRVIDDGVGFVKPKPNAAGLGLRVLAYRARMMGAQIEVRTGDHGGCQFTCSLVRAAL